MDHHFLREILSRTGADYAAFWREHDGRLYIWEHFEPPELLAELLLADHGDASFVKESYKHPVDVDDPKSPVAHAHRSKGEPDFLTTLHGSSLSKLGEARDQLSKKFKINSNYIIFM